MDKTTKQAVGQVAMGLAEAISPLLHLSGDQPGEMWTVTVAHAGVSITAHVNMDSLFGPIKTRGGKDDDA